MARKLGKKEDDNAEFTIINYNRRKLGTIKIIRDQNDRELMFIDYGRRKREIETPRVRNAMKRKMERNG